MKVSDMSSAPIALGAALRHRRLFHPDGVLARGSIERLAPPRVGLPVEGAEVVARVSKGLGTPGPLPDAAGLAWRMPPAAFAPTPWDVLLVTASDRVLLHPVVSWSSAVFSSLMPLQYDGEAGNSTLWWIRARMTTRIAGTGLSLRPVADRIRNGGVWFEIEQCCGRGDFIPLARLGLTEVLPDGEDVAFDPVRHTVPGVRVWPRWLRDVREAAYRSSRAGRHAG